MPDFQNRQDAIKGVLRIKRVYAKPAPDDGVRILVDRLWPRGLSKEDAHIDRWLKDIAPSSGLRKWFGHRPERWEEFRQRYLRELEEKSALLEEIRSLIKKKPLTLLYSAKDEDRNNARVLFEILRSG